MVSINPKLDSFLAKRLSKDELTNIKTCEVAIIDANGTLRYVVLTNRHLYLIDSPPKNIKLVVPYQEIATVKLEHNYVPFLKGIDRENCQHVKLEILNSEGIAVDENSKVENSSNAVALNLYIRSKSSSFSSVLKHSCTRNIIRTARQTPNDDSQRDTFTNKTENVQFLFQQLRMDLIESEDDVEHLYVYLRELEIGARKSFMIKKLFWKDLALVDFLLSQLTKYCQSSSLNLENSLTAGARSDELELCSIIFEVFAEFIGETEHLKDRNNFLQEREFAYTRRLLNLCISEPAMPESFKRPPKTRSVAHAFDKFSRCFEESESAEQDLLMIYCSYTLARQSLLFELIITAAEMKWINPSSRFDIKWIASQLRNHSNFEEYLRCLFWLAMIILDLTISEKTTSQQSLWLFQILSMVQTLLDFDANVKEFVKTEFEEEFKYYFLPEIVKKRLSEQDALTSKILGLIGMLREIVVPKA